MKDRISLFLVAIAIGSLFIFGFPFVDRYFGLEKGSLFSYFLSLGFICTILSYKCEKKSGVCETDRDK